MIAERFRQSDVDEHVWLTVECADRPTISFDILNWHGRRTLSIRLDGMTHYSMLLDTAHLDPKGDVIYRYCPLCGEEINILSSKSHACKDE